MLVLFVVALIGATLADLNWGTTIDPGSQRVVNRLFCDNSAAFALTGALEIASQRLTGSSVKLSEQEIIDCHYGGCDQILLSQLVTWLQIQDRLAPAAGYYPFQSKQDNDGTSCRAGQAPNALDKISITGLESITVADIDDSLALHGAVFACMDNRDESCPGYYKRKSQITADAKDMHIYQDNDNDGFIDGYEEWFTGENEHVVTGLDASLCYHNVLIVGTYSADGTDYYIVRDSRGSTWSRKGHFLIARGGNECGIENYLKVLLTELKAPAASQEENGCSLSLPKFCEASSTCTAADQECIAVDEEVTYDPKTGPHSTNATYDFSGSPECEDISAYSEVCGKLSWGECMEPQFKEYCAGTCLVCARDSCEDVESVKGECARYIDYCHLSAVRAMCARTCQMHPSDCGTLAENIELLVGVERPAHGDCHAPSIPFGTVVNADYLASGEQLVIECSAGYVLSGTPNYCVIQNVFGPDSRMMQECVLVADDSFTGTGFDIAGQLSVNTDGTECSNWQEVVYQGWYDSSLDLTAEQGKAYLAAGNNNYCRNPVGEIGAFEPSFDVAEITPFCLSNKIALGGLSLEGRDVTVGDDLDIDDLVSETALKKYCFDKPKCGGNYCDNLFVADLIPCFVFSASDCSIESAGATTAAFVWGMCQKTCCDALNCPEAIPELLFG